MQWKITEKRRKKISYYWVLFDTIRSKYNRQKKSFLLYLIPNIYNQILMTSLVLSAQQDKQENQGAKGDRGDEGDQDDQDDQDGNYYRSLTK